MALSEEDIKKIKEEFKALMNWLKYYLRLLDKTGKEKYRKEYNRIRDEIKSLEDWSGIARDGTKVKIKEKLTPNDIRGMKDEDLINLDPTNFAEQFAESLGERVLTNRDKRAARIHIETRKNYDR